MPATSSRPPSLYRSRNRPDAWGFEPNNNPTLPTVGPLAAVPGDLHLDGHSMPWSGWHDEWQTPWYEIGRDEWTGFGYGRKDPEGYMGRISTVGTLVDLNSSQLASFPLYGVDDIYTEKLPSWAINPQPEVYADWSDFMMALANDLLLHGEAFLWATERFADGYPARFMVLPHDQVDVITDDGFPWYTHDRTPLPRRDVLHIRYQVRSGRFRGISPLEWAAAPIRSAEDLQRYAADIATQGLWAVLKHPANLNASQRDDLRSNWVASRRAAGGAPAVLSGGVEFETVTLSPQDMALLDLRNLDMQQICAAFRTPAHLVEVPSAASSMTYQNVSQVTDHHWRVGLRTTAKKIASALSNWALPGSHRVEFDRDEYVRPGLSERAQAYSTLHGIVNDDGHHAMTVDEVRVAERLRPKRPEARGEVLIGDNA